MPQDHTSGAMYSTVPTGLIASSCRVLMVSPKSPSLMTCSPVRKMFSSLMSLFAGGRFVCCTADGVHQLLVCIIAMMMTMTMRVVVIGMMAENAQQSVPVDDVEGVKHSEARKHWYGNIAAHLTLRHGLFGAEQLLKQIAGTACTNIMNHV